MTTDGSRMTAKQQPTSAGTNARRVAPGPVARSMESDGPAAATLTFSPPHHPKEPH